MTTRKTFAWTLLALAPLAASAQVEVYFGAGAVGARIQRFDVTATSSFTDTFSNSPPIQYNFSTNKLSGDDLGYHGFVGVRVGQYFAVEGGYLNLGVPESNFNYRLPSYPPGPTCVNPPAGPCVRPVTDDVLRLQDAIDGYEAYGIGRLPVTERIELFGKVGIFAWKSEVSVTDTVAALQKPNPPDVPAITITPAGTIKDDGVGIAAGGGVSFKMSGNFQLRAQGTWYDVKDTKTVWSVGFDLVYHIPL
jgi:opacity protein-like surface antigen